MRTEWRRYLEDNEHRPGSIPPEILAQLRTHLRSLPTTASGLRRLICLDNIVAWAEDNANMGTCYSPAWRRSRVAGLFGQAYRRIGRAIQRSRGRAPRRAVMTQGYFPRNAPTSLELVALGRQTLIRLGARPPGPPARGLGRELVPAAVNWAAKVIEEAAANVCSLVPGMQLIILEAIRTAAESGIEARRGSPEGHLIEAEVPIGTA